MISDIGKEVIKRPWINKIFLGGKDLKFDQRIIETELHGEWYRKPESDWYVDNITINPAQAKMEFNKGHKVMFIAIDSDTWHKGSGNRGIYSGWTDTHTTVSNHQKYISGAIVARPIPELDPSIPQYVVEDTYQTIKILADYAYTHRTGKMIAITGTAGKSTSKGLLDTLLSHQHQTVSTRGNHNTRTGVPLTIANTITQPDYTIIEAAISSLWMRSGGIMKNYAPDIAMITSIDGGQQKDVYQTAVLKAKIAEGMNQKGTVVLNRDMNAYETVKQSVEQYNRNIITYGFNEQADSKIISVKETRTTTLVEADVLGEWVKFETQLNGNGMIQNILGVLTIIKLLNVELLPLLPEIKKYKPNKAVQNFDVYQTKEGHQFTLINDTWNATGIAMIEAIKLLSTKAKYHKGKSIALIGRIENLSEEEAKRQHEAVADAIIESDIDIVYAHGPEMKYMLRKLPPTKIGGYYESAELIARHIANVIEDDDIVMLKGSPRSSNFKFVKDELLKAIQSDEAVPPKTSESIHSNGYGVATYDLETGEKVASFGKQDVIQNQGVGGLLVINHILDLLFAKKLNLTTEYRPDAQSIRESQSQNAISLSNDSKLSLEKLIQAAVVKNAPNTLLMLANTVIGSNQKSMKVIREMVGNLHLSADSAHNITGRRIRNKRQALTLDSLFKVGEKLYTKAPLIQDLLSQKIFTHQNQTYRAKTNLYHYGMITHGLFYGQNDSIGVTLSKLNGRKYVSVVIGAQGMFHRDALIYQSLSAVITNNVKPYPSEAAKVIDSDKSVYTINVLGDTYFGEFYTRIRLRQGKEDALTRFGRAYSFDQLRPFIQRADFNICNFEAAISDDRNEYLKMRKPYVLHADSIGNVSTLKNEKINLVTLANNHLMDCGVEGLNQTIDQFQRSGIDTIGAGREQNEAEKPYVMNINNQRITFFNAYWYRKPMYEAFDFYAIGDEPGVACMNMYMLEAIKAEKEKYPTSKIVVIAHWGVDFKSVHPLQVEYAEQLSAAGADLIIGHGAHMIQKVEKIGHTTVSYSIGNGVFNSNGEYNKRFVPAYSMIAQLILEENQPLKLRFYPIYGNNLETFWQPRFLNEEEFKHFINMMKTYGSENMEIGKDDYYYIETVIS